MEIEHAGNGGGVREKVDENNLHTYEAVREVSDKLRIVQKPKINEVWEEKDKWGFRARKWDTWFREMKHRCPYHAWSGPMTV